jgi:hypothetical protein
MASICFLRIHLCLLLDQELEHVEMTIRAIMMVLSFLGSFECFSFSDLPPTSCNSYKP